MLKTVTPDAFMQVSGFAHEGERIPFVTLIIRPEQVFGIDAVDPNVKVDPGKFSRTD